MGINACILSWFENVADAGHFAGQSSVLELGPQDFFFPSEILIDTARRRSAAIGTVDQSKAEQDARCILSGDLPYAERQALFYSMFGLERYASVDTYDDRATYRQNLNVASAAPERFDLIVDCGTTEHVFNLANVFVYTHNTLNPGGVTLKVLPTFGDNTHGFYNIHPTVYFDIARENGYEILDFRYVNNMIGRSDLEGAASLLPQDRFEAGLLSFAGCAGLQEAISSSFLETLTRAKQDGRIGQAHNSVDYCFVAMRKVDDAPFRYPGQGVYLSEFPPSAHE